VLEDEGGVKIVNGCLHRYDLGKMDIILEYIAKIV